MPMRVGEMMVVIRAQDFASRTLRRVGGEFAHMSRQQMIAAKRADLAFREMQASSRVRQARMDMRPLQLIQRRIDLTKRLALENAAVADQMRRVQRFTPTDTRLIGTGQRELMRQNVRELVRLEQQSTRTGRSIDRYNAAIDKLGPSYMRANSSAFHFERLQTQATRNLAAAEQGLTKAQRAQLAYNAAIRQMPINRLHDAARALGGIGRTMQLFGAVGTIAFGVAATQAADFSKSASLAATQVTRIGAGTGEAIANSEELRKKILKLGRDYPFAAKEMAEATYEIFSSTNVSNINQGMALLDAFSRVAVGGQVDLMTATKASITVINTFKGASDDITSTLNRMFSIVRFGRLRFSDFADMLPKVAAAAYGAGQRLDDVAGIIAFLSRKTGDAGIAATQISRAFDVFSRKEFRQGIRNLGVDIEDAQGKLLPLPQVLQRIFDRWGTELARGGRGAERFIQIVTRASNIAGKGLLSTAEARRFFRFIFSDFDLYTDLQNKVTKNNKEFQRSFETMMADPGVRWDIFINKLRILITEIGLKAIPVFENLGQHVARLMDWWDRISESTQANIVKWGVLISVGALVGGIFLSIIGAVGGLMASFGGMILQLGGRGGLVGRMAMLARFAGALAGIGAIVLALKVLWTGEATARDFLMGVIAGAGIGFLLGGPAGAVVGAITVPIILKVIADSDKTPQEQAFDAFQKQLGGNPSFFDAVSVDAGSPIKAFKQFYDYVEDAGKVVGMGREEFNRQWDLMVKATQMKVATPALIKQLEEVNPLIRKLFDKYNKGIKDGNKTNMDSFAEWRRKLNAAYRSGDKKLIAKLLGIDPDSLQGIEEGFDEANSEMKQFQDQMKQWNKGLQDAATQGAKSAIDNLRSMYTTMLTENQQAFGALFQGPWLTSETFDLAKEWGITPQINDIIKDLDMQIAQFNERRNMIDKLFKRGLPQDFLNELRQMSPEEAMPILQELIDATPAQTRTLITKLNQRQASIKKATMIDFTRELNAFKKAGNDMGRLMIEGFQNAGVGPWFDNWVKTTFPGVINAAVATAISDYKKNTPLPERPKLPPSAAPQGGNAPGGRGNNTSNTNNNQKTQVNNINLGGAHDEQIASANQREAGRKLAFQAINTIRGIRF